MSHAYTEPSRSMLLFYRFVTTRSDRGSSAVSSPRLASTGRNECWSLAPARAPRRDTWRRP